MKLKATIEEAKTRARNKLRELNKIEEPDIEEHEEIAYYEGVLETLEWVCGKREVGIDDFIKYKY